MSLRKLLSLLLLTAFTVTSITPASATISFNSSVTLPTLAQDDGTRADGANRDTIPLTLRIGYASGDVTFAPDGGAGGVANGVQNGDSFLVKTDGTLVPTGFTVASPYVAVFVPPTGTEFVKLQANAYTDTTAATTLGSSALVNGVTLQNVTAAAATQASFPASGVGDYIVASVLTAAANGTVFGTGAGTEFPAGSLVVHFFSKQDTAQAVGAAGTVVINGIGLAADPGSSLGSSGALNITYKTPNAGASAASALNVTDGSTIQVATLGDNVGKLEFLMVGSTTGTEVSTTAEPDAQPNTILASQISGTSVTVAPGLVTSVGTSLSTANLDTDTLLIRGAERADSTSSSRTYYETPFNTSALVLTQVQNGREAATMRDISVSSSNTTNFPNASNALITVTFALETPAGASTDATLAVNAVTVGLVGPRAFNGYRNTGTTVGGQTQALEGNLTGVRGFLGAMINSIDNPTTPTGAARRTLYGAASIYNGTASVAQYQVKDTFTADYRVQNAQRGITSANINAVVIAAGNDTPTSVSSSAPGSDRTHVFPGSLIINGNVAGNGAAAWDLVNTANGSGSSPFTFSLASSNQSYINTTEIYDPSELSVRLINGTAGASIGNAAFYIVHGTNGADTAVTVDNFRVSSTNVNAAGEMYDNGFTLKVPDNTADASNNVIAAAELEANVLKIMPISQKFDGLRDVITIRPEATITLTSGSKTTGVNLVATATGNNLPSGGVKITLAKVLPTGGFTAGLDIVGSSVLPVHGTIGTPALMRESSTNAGTSRAAIQLSGVTGATTSTDSLDDLVGTSNSLDTTVPPLFCGGSVGTSTRGPNGVVFQPKSRAIVLRENGSTNFQAIEDLGSNTVIRVTLPTGWDLNKYTATNGNILATGVSGGLSTTIVRAEAISSTITRAFIDLTVDSSSTTVTTKRLLGLFFKPNSLVVPSGVSSFTANIDIYNNAGTASITDDTLVGNIGTVALGSACSTFLTVAFCDDAVSSYVDPSATAQTTDTGKVSVQKSSLSDFGTSPSSIKRLVNSAATNEVTLPDLCITEGVADALPAGAVTDGVPNAFGVTSSTTVGDVEIHIASSFAGSTSTGDVGLDTAATSVLFSDKSIITDGASSVVTTGDDNEVIVPIKEGTDSTRKRPFEETTTIRVSGLKLDQAAASQPVTAQNLIVWAEVVTAAGSYAVGSNSAIGLENTNTTTNEFFVSNVVSSGDEDERYSNFFSDRVVDTTTGTVTETSFGDNSATAATNTLQVAQTQGNHAKVTSAVMSLLDNTGYDLLNEDTTFTVELADITSSTDKSVTVSAGAGSLEPGTLVAVANSGTGNSDSVTVPVLDDGSFIATIRANTSQSITVTQSPTSTQAGALQVRTLSVAEQNVDPVITSAVADDIGLGTLTKKGTAPAVFTVAAKGKLDGADYVPTVANLTLGTGSVTAVTGSTTQFLGIANLSASTGLTVTSEANGTTSTATLTGLTTSNPTLNGAPILKSVKVNKKGKITLSGTRLRNGGTFGFVLADGTYSPVDLAPQNANQVKTGKRTSASTASIPTDAVFAVFHVAGRGVSTIEL